MPLPFHITITAGAPAYQQVLDAVHRALANGQLTPGSAFPSVRELSKTARINPNTAHKVVQHLVADDVLEVIPGRGTRVRERAELSAQAKADLLVDLAERLTISAKRHGLEREDVDRAITRAGKKSGQKTALPKQA